MGILEVENVSYIYPRSSTPAIRGVSFDVPPGEVFGFLGPSGAGKSTMQRILIGLRRDYAGTVRVLGRDLRQWRGDYYERIGVSFELPNHYVKLTARENLALFASLYANPQSPESVLDAVALLEHADKPVAQLSKGMKVRLNLARALLNRPDVLFLDEPTAGLDPVTAKAIRALIRQQQDAGATVFLTTHDMAVADALCTRVAFIVDGEIRAVGRPAALKRRYGRRAVRVETGGEPNVHEFPLEGVADNAAFLALLRRSDLLTVHTLETTLDDVFVQVTGRSLT
jgi:fluoroquinolone transport system ATP-binding protein